MKKRHEYKRHIVTTLVAWFSFFVTFNYTTMGLILNATDKLTKFKPEFQWLVYMFVGQVCLGLLACLAAGIGVYILVSRNNFRPENAGGDTVRAVEGPDFVYFTWIALMFIGLIPIGVAWWYMPHFVK